MKKKRLIVGIDPGLASGGVVVLQRRPQEILAAYSMIQPKGAVKDSKAQATLLAEYVQGFSDTEFTSAVLRAYVWMEQFKEVVPQIEAMGEIVCFAIESFVDQRSRAREEKERLVANRWMTPLQMGMMIHYLRERGYCEENHQLQYQNAGRVIKQMSWEINALKNKQHIIDGGHLVTNDHTRKACAHALSADLRNPK